jgi:hypothetical protein
MTKTQILAEIQRTAGANGGVPLGKARFEAETGIRTADWCGKHWVRWSDALREAGLRPNQFTAAYDDEKVLERYAKFAQELATFPSPAICALRLELTRIFPATPYFGASGASKSW